MELHAIRYFLALSESLNFTKAAQECDVSQPALTRAIQKMEDELGGLLFSRERNNTHLTQLGKLIEPNLREVMTRTQQVEKAATRFLKLEEANLALGVMCTIAPLQFFTFLDRFRMDNPGCEVTLLDSMPDRLCELLIKGELDVALIARPDGFPAPLKAVKLYSEPFVIACSAGHPFAQQATVRVTELNGEVYLSRINCEFGDAFSQTCLEHGAHLVTAYQSEREDWILTMVAAGMGICLLPEYTATFPGVVGRPITSPSLERDVCLVSVAGRRSSPPVAAFVNSARRYPWPAAGSDGLDVA